MRILTDNTDIRASFSPDETIGQSTKVSKMPTSYRNIGGKSALKGYTMDKTPFKRPNINVN
jgi:hypothetical protein